MAKNKTAKIEEATKIANEVVNETTTNVESQENNETLEVEIEESLEQKYEELIEQLDEQKNKYLRLFADFDNYKKRTAKEKLNLLNTAGKDVMLAIIPTFDDLDRALQSAETATEVNAVIEGFNLVKTKMFNTLAQKGLKAMDSIGNEFNPDIHEALTKIPAPNKEMKGKVIDVIEKGYTLNETIIRYAKVVVGE